VVTLDGFTAIPGKDNIVIATFKENGYEVIVQKNDFKSGDLAVYVEYDTVLPQWPQFEFLRKRCYKEKYGGFLISAMKMGGVVSYGIAFALEQLKEVMDPSKMKPGMDLTETLKVASRDVLDENLQTLAALKQTKPRSFVKKLGYKLAHRFPRIAAVLMHKRKAYEYPIPKTDETRIENLPGVYENWKGATVDGTLKMDGSSVSISIANGDFYLMSRNNVLFKAPLKKLMKIEAKNLPLDKWLKKIDKLSWSAHFSAMPNVLMVCHRDKWIENISKMAQRMSAKSLTLQGELCGPGIQKNRMHLKELKWSVFNLTSDGRNYYNWSYINDRAFQFLNIHFVTVPRIYHGEFKWKDKAEIKAFANALKYEDGSLAEGVVFRKCDPFSNNYYCQPEKGMSNMASLKVISDEYVLKHKD
jgi:hypothetical protein